MKSETTQVVRLADLVAKLAASRGNDNFWEFVSAADGVCDDVAGQTHETLQAPLDFPSIESAIVAGDRVALAVDPNVPRVAEVVTGILKTLAMTDAGEIDIVLWDEVSDATLAAIRDVVGDTATIVKHDPSHRESLRYLAADQAATPIYLNRLLVDADFVLPVVSSRAMDALDGQDLTGVFPSLADSSSRHRHRQRMVDAKSATEDEQDLQIPWLLGVHLIVAVRANADGEVAQVIAGTPDAIRKTMMPSDASASDFPPPAELVIASMDGDRQQQTWVNAARALAAASRRVAAGGTIVLWTAIDQPPSGILAQLEDLDESESIFMDDLESTLDTDEGEETPIDFPAWNSQLSVAATFSRVLSEHRVLIRSLLASESIEPMGLGVVEDEPQLIRVSQSFETQGVLRAAQFADGTIDSPHRSSQQSDSSRPNDDDNDDG